MKKLLLFFLLVYSTISANETITWGVFHRPPSIDISDISNPSGYSGELLKIMQANMSKYDFRYQDMKMLRILKAIKDKEKVCNNFLYKNPQREEFAYFSLPLRINLPLRIVMRQELFKKLGSPKSLSIKNILKQNRLNIIIENGRSYSKIDNILSTHKGTNLLKEVITSKQLLEMLNLNRVDMVIEYSDVVTNHRKEDIDNFAFVSIKEMPKYGFSHAVCPKNEWGKMVINDINNALRNIVYTDKFKTHLNYLYSHKKDQDEIISIYQSDFLNEYK